MNVTPQEALHDVETREQQLRWHILRSEEYLERFQREFKRQVLMLYLSIVLLFLFQSLFAWNMRAHLQMNEAALILITTLLAIMNCILLIHTKSWLRRVNQAWIEPQEKIALDSIEIQKREILERLSIQGA